MPVSSPPPPPPPKIIHQITLAQLLTHILSGSSAEEDEEGKEKQEDHGPRSGKKAEKDSTNRITQSSQTHQKRHQDQAATATTTTTTIIICTTRTRFLQTLLVSLPASPGLQASTLAELSSSQQTKLFFVDSVQALLAHLGIYSMPGRTLYLVYGIRLYRDTGPYCAQGLQRFFASAVDASLRAGAGLVFIEPGLWRDLSGSEDSLHLADPVHQLDAQQTTGEAQDGHIEQNRIWEDKVPMLASTSGRLKLAGHGERAWLGRTVSVADIAGRWCEFETYQNIAAGTGGKKGQ